VTEWPARQVARRRPLIPLSIGIAVLTWMAFWESEGIAADRHTVTHGWGTGLAVAGMAHVATFAVLGLALIVWAAAKLSRRAGPATAQASPPRPAMTSDARR
jgi:hypothetical protein